MNVLKPNQKSAIITLLQNSVSQHEIQRKTGIDRKTIRKYARQEGLWPGGEISNSPVATSLRVGVIQIPPPRPPDGAASKFEKSEHKIPSDARSACEPHRGFIEDQVRLKRNSMAIFQELVDQHGFEHKYNSVKRFCRGLKRSEPEQFDRLEFLPGEEAQVDYGEGALTLHPTTGKYRRPRLFVMTLRYSRRSFRKVVWKSSSEIWARLHEEAFRYFGGCPQYIVLDNLKEGVIKPDIYEPELNRVYTAMLAHYGVVADPARVRDPNRKGAVENAIQHTQSTALQGKRFESIEEQNEHLMKWEEKWAASRIHGREKRQVETMFQEEKPHLKILPVVSFRYFEEGTRTVQDDTTIQVGGSWYAARPAPIGSEVIVRIYELEIEIRDVKTLELIRRHPLSVRKGEVKLPNNERVFNPSRETHVILKQAEKIGPKASELCRLLFENRGREGQKSMWGVVGLAKRYPTRIVEQACELGLKQGTRSAKVIREIVDGLFEKAVAQIDAAQPELSLGSVSHGLTQEHELIRGAEDYAAFFNQSVRQKENQAELTSALTQGETAL